MTPRLLAVTLLGLLSAQCTIRSRHHVRRFDDRRTAATSACAEPEIITDRGGDRPRQTLAVVTAECAPSKQAECRRELQRGVCSVSGDAIIEVTERPTRGTLRMVGIAVAWTDDEAPPAPVPVEHRRRGMQ